MYTLTYGGKGHEIQRGSLSLASLKRLYIYISLQYNACTLQGGKGSEPGEAVWPPLASQNRLYDFTFLYF